MKNHPADACCSVPSAFYSVTPTIRLGNSADTVPQDAGPERQITCDFLGIAFPVYEALGYCCRISRFLYHRMGPRTLHSFHKHFLGLTEWKQKPCVCLCVRVATTR